MSRRGRAVTFSAVQSKKVNSTLSTFQNKNKPPDPEVLEDSTTKVDEDFFKRIIELENEIQLSQNPSLPLIEELIKLYEKGIVSFTESHSRQKVQYFKNKLTKLLMGYNKLKKKQADNKKPSSWSKFMNAHKKNKNKFMLFLNVETSKKEATNILDNREQKISAGYNQITKDLEEQNKKFLERKKGTKKMNMEKKGNEIKNENENIDIENNNEENGENYSNFNYLIECFRSIEGPFYKIQNDLTTLDEEDEELIINQMHSNDEQEKEEGKDNKNNM